MTRFRVGAVGAAVLLAAGPVGAQPPVPGGARATRPPVFSPWLNLVRPGGSPVLNYYGLVRPEVEFRREMMNQAIDIQENRRAIGGLADEVELPTTGHQTMFMSTGGFFGTGGAAALSGGGRGGGGGLVGSGVFGAGGAGRGTIRPVNRLDVSPGAGPQRFGAPVNNGGAAPQKP